MTSLLPNTGLETTSCLFFEAAPCTVAPLGLTVEWSRPRWVRSGPTTRNLDCFWSWEPALERAEFFQIGTGWTLTFFVVFFQWFQRFSSPFFSQCTGVGVACFCCLEFSENLIFFSNDKWCKVSFKKYFKDTYAYHGGWWSRSSHYQYPFFLGKKGSYLSLRSHPPISNVFSCFFQQLTQCLPDLISSFRHETLQTSYLLPPQRLFIRP